MILARIVGTVVSTRKDPRLEGKKLLVVKPISPEGADEIRLPHRRGHGRLRVSRDRAVVTGSSARMAAECKDRPVDAAIIGIVDEVKLDALHEAELAAARKGRNLGQGRTCMKYRVILEPDLEAGGFLVSCPALPGCHSQGETRDEALANIRDAIEGYLASLRSTTFPELV